MRMNLRMWMVGSLCLCLGFAVATLGISSSAGLPVSDELASQLYGGMCGFFPGAKNTSEAAAKGFLVCNLRLVDPNFDDPDWDLPLGQKAWCSAHVENGMLVVDCGLIGRPIDLVNPSDPTQTGGTLKPTSVLPCADTGCNDGYPATFASCGI